MTTHEVERTLEGEELDHALQSMRLQPLAAITEPHAVTRNEMQMQLAAAHDYPRKAHLFKNEMRQYVLKNEAVAAECSYALPRAGKTIEGPSIRFAEILVACWRNCHVGTRIVDERAEVIVAQAVFWDLERNTKTIEEVQRRITDSKGRRFNSDMIVVTGNAARSIAWRNAVLHGIPKPEWQPYWLEARKLALGDVQSFATKRAAAIKAFVAYGVTDQQIYKRLGVLGEADVTIDHLQLLQGFLVSIKDENVAPETIFAEDKPEPPAPTSGVQAAKDALK